MHLELEPASGKNFIQSFEPGTLKVNNVQYTTNLLLTPDSLKLWEVNSIEKLSKTDLQTMLDYNPEIIIIGTGATSIFLPASLISFVQQQKVGIESMTTAAACRTFNILLNESRKVLAALIV